MSWPGVIEHYRERLPLPSGAKAVTLLEGNTPLIEAPRLAAVLGLEGRLSEVRRAQSDLLVQRPRHDDGDHDGGGRRGDRGHLRLDRKHVGIGGSIIGGNVWLTKSVPPYSKVYHVPPSLRVMPADDVNGVYLYEI